ncbi:hypothetical protein BDN67DRAFT_973333 [Paxillus ammoniavirescens]|nr:hypothetical protein BDN67DRAFT_973333 [Paxillus ammoniavirescens]
MSLEGKGWIFLDDDMYVLWLHQFATTTVLAHVVYRVIFGWQLGPASIYVPAQVSNPSLVRRRCG